MNEIICKSTGEICKTYKEYLNSNHWKQTRKRYYKSKLPKSCYVCGTSKNLNLHHKTYKRIGKERLNDLIPLCREHHKLVHKALRDKKLNDVIFSKTRTNLWNITKKVKTQVNRKSKHYKN